MNVRHKKKSLKFKSIKVKSHLIKIFVEHKYNCLNYDSNKYFIKYYNPANY